MTMEQSNFAIKTEVGIVRGRDAIYLESVEFDYSSNRIRFCGSFNPHLCSDIADSDEEVGFELVFSGLLALQMIELDFDMTDGVSSFDEVRDSEWLKRMKAKDHSAKVSESHRHFVLATYDDVFVIIADRYELQLIH